MYSNEYITQLQSLHNDEGRPQGFGGKVKDLGKFYHFINEWNPKSLLDYGCGKGVILAHLIEKYPNIKCTGYDPAVPMFSKIKKQNFDCVFSNDVLEHIEPNMIDLVLNDINLKALNYIWLRIDTIPARKELPDGRNAHLILQSPKWWTAKLSKFIDGNIIYSNLNKKGKFDIAIKK